MRRLAEDIAVTLFFGTVAYLALTGIVRLVLFEIDEWRKRRG
jgi:hypothetical protein